MVLHFDDWNAHEAQQWDPDAASDAKLQAVRQQNRMLGMTTDASDPIELDPWRWPVLIGDGLVLLFNTVVEVVGAFLMLQQLLLWSALPMVAVGLLSALFSALSLVLFCRVEAMAFLKARGVDVPLPDRYLWVQARCKQLRFVVKQRLHNRDGYDEEQKEDVWERIQEAVLGADAWSPTWQDQASFAFWAAVWLIATLAGSYFFLSTSLAFFLPSLVGTWGGWLLVGLGMLSHVHFRLTLRGASLQTMLQPERRYEQLRKAYQIDAGSVVSPAALNLGFT